MSLLLNHILRSRPKTFKLQQLNILTRLASTSINIAMVGETRLLPAVGKSPLDSREYRALELPNKIKAILISDPKTDKSAASMSVAAGSMNDPVELPGLAHFCEHMLFLGTKKYPTENDYSKFLSDNGGSSNAYTAKDHTNYYFDVSPLKLDSALDKFSQFFISPLFTESATEREVNAVNSEHDKNLSSDLWRINQLQCGLANPDHPFSRFATGNRETLWNKPQENKIDVRSALMDYHKKLYSANLMNLTVLGSESLDELQGMVESKFRVIENNNAVMPRWPENPFGPKELKARVDILPVKDVRHLSIQFPTPDLTQHYKSGSEQYVSHLIGHEGCGSILSLLKKKNWVNTLSAGGQPPARGFGIFKITMDLTPEGLKHTDEIITIIFQYLHLLRTAGSSKWIWEELKTLSGLMFQYKDKEHPQNLVSQVSSSLHEIPAEDVLTAGFIISEYDKDLIDRILSHLTPEECLIMSSSKSYESKVDKREKWYGVKYSYEKLKEEQIEKWIKCGSHPDLKLPEPNKFIPQRFDLKPREEEKGIIPKVVAETELSRIWFLQDNEFLMPKGAVKAEIYSCLPLLDPKHHCLNSLLAMGTKDLLVEESYAANAAGLFYDVGSSAYGLEVSVHGYEDKLDILMKKVIETISNFTCSQARFDVLKDWYSRSLKNWYDEQPYTHAVYYMGYLLREKRWQLEELITALNDVTLESLMRYSRDFVEKLKMEWLVCGNFTPLEAENLVRACERYLIEKGTQALTKTQVHRLRELKLPAGTNHLFKSSHFSHQSSCTAVLLQAGVLTMKESVVLELLDHILNEPYFTQLRTVEQLGYIVFSGLRRVAGTEGFQFIVQTHRHPAYVDSRIDAFIQNLDGSLRSMSEDIFRQHKIGLTVKLSEKPKKMRDRAALIWSEISIHEFIFDRQQLELLELEKVTHSDVVTLFSKFMGPSAIGKRRLGIHVLSEVEGSNIVKNDKEIIDDVEKNSTIIEDGHSFKGTMELYPLPCARTGKAKL